MLKVLRKNKSFRNLWIGQLISALGDRLTQMGILTFIMIANQGKGDKMALITFFSLLPFLLFGPFFGAMVDRFSRKMIMIIADFLRAGMVLFIPLIWIHTHSVPVIVSWFFLLGALTALFSPAKMSIIANITAKDDLLQANSLIITTGMIATLVGTLIAAAVVKVTGINYAFAVNCTTYIISALFIFGIVYKRQPVAHADGPNAYRTFISDIKQGIHYTLSHRLILQLIMLSGIFSFISSFAYILVLNYGSLVLKQGPLGMGVLLSSAGFGMVIGSIILMKCKDKVRYNRALYLSYLIIGVSLAAIFFRPNFLLTLVVLFCAGIGVSIFTIAVDTIVQRITPDNLKGKVFAARGIVTNSIFLLSLLIVGFLIKIISSPVLFAFVGLCAIATSVNIFLFNKYWGYAILRFIFRFILKLLFNYKVSGLENIPKNRPVIFAGNHTSFIDGVALACAYPKRMYFIIADSVLDLKFWGWCAKKLGYISVKRGGYNKTALKTAIKVLKQGFSLGIFPEGKISLDGQINEAKAGLATIARLAQVDVVPFAIEGVYEAWPLNQKNPKRFPVELRFGRPLKLKDFAIPEDLVKEVMAYIAKVKVEMEKEGYLRADPAELIRHIIN